VAISAVASDVLLLWLYRIWKILVAFSCFAVDEIQLHSFLKFTFVEGICRFLYVTFLPLFGDVDG
jgi:hypothetical protein